MWTTSRPCIGIWWRELSNEGMSRHGRDVSEGRGGARITWEVGGDCGFRSRPKTIIQF